MTPQEAVRAALTETIWWAREASQNRETPSGYEEDGARWEWVCGHCSWKNNKIPTEGIDPVQHEHVSCPQCGTVGVVLAGTRKGAQHVTWTVEEIPVAVGIHLLRNDPRSAIQLSEALLKILDICDGTLTDHFEDEHFRMACTLAAAVIAVLKSGVVCEPR